MGYTYEFEQHENFIKVNIKSTDSAVSGWMLFWQTLIVKEWCQQFMVDILKNCGYKHFTLEFPAFSVGMLFNHPIEFVIYKASTSNLDLLDHRPWKYAARAIMFNTSSKPLWMYSTSEILTISKDNSKIQYVPYRLFNED